MPLEHVRRTRLSILALLTALVAALSIIPAAAAAPSAPSKPAPSKPAPVIEPVAWTRCNGDFFCGQVKVPLDYDRPTGPQISLALAMLPATDRARRIGSLFVNPGGPGGSGVDFVLNAGPFLFTPEVRARFDIVGFDPRGIIRSSPLRCFATEEEAFATLAPFPYPNSRAKERVWIAGERQLNAACARRGGPILNHMSTADVARDLDQLRQAVGDRMLSYYGVSYGSFLGNVYANLFPNRFRALVIDGVLDPVAWTTGRGRESRTLPFSTRLRSAEGAQAELREFFRLCDAGGPNCAFAPNAGQRYADLYRTLRRNPLTLPLPDGTTIAYDESFLVGDTLGALYDSAVWPDLAALLVELEAATNPAQIQARVVRLRQALQQDDYPNFVEGFPGVACSDSVNPKSYDAWRRAANISRYRDGIFGPLWTWITSVCAEWPGRAADRYLGPFTARTARTVLVVGNLFDPATAYSGAVVADRLLPNSRLLTVRAWAHTSLFQSSCADAAIAGYLLTSQPPARGTVCQPNVVPFAQPPAATQRTPGSTRDGSAVERPIRPHW